MIRDTRRARLLWQALACATLCGALAACGGGGGSGGGGGGGGNGGGGGVVTPTESAYLLAEFVAVDSNNQFVRVWDPAAPTTAVQNVRITVGNGIVWQYSHLVFSDATRYDAGTRKITTLGHARVFYDNDGKLYTIDLRGGHSHAPVQLSNAVDVFLPRSAIALNAAGDDAWVDVMGGPHDWAIRTTMDASATPVSVLRLVAPLRDATTGLPRFLFASLGGASGTHVDPTTFEVVDTSFNVVPVPAVGGMTGSTFDGWIGADPVQPGMGYLRIANQVRALRWASGTVSVDAGSVVPIADSLQGMISVSDGQSLYVTSGLDLLALANGVSRRVGAFSSGPTTLVDAGTWIAAQETTSATSAHTTSQIETLRKSDGTRVLVEDANPDLQLLGASGDLLVMTGTVAHGPAFFVTSGGATVGTTIGAQAVGVVRSATSWPDQQPAPVAVIACASSGTSGFCGAGAVTQTALDGSGAVGLGTLSLVTPVWLRGDLVAGVAGSLSGQTFLPTAGGGFGDDETDLRDAWQATSGGAGSLARVSANLP